MAGAEVPLYPVETVRIVELGSASVTKIPVTVRGDPKGCRILEQGFPYCRFFMPSKEGYVRVINDAEGKMYVPEGTIMGIGQDWEEEEEQEIEAPNNTAYKRWSCHSKQKLPCKLGRIIPPPAMGA